jgi:hypothetical protein
MPQPKFFKPYRGFAESLAERKRLYVTTDLCVAEQEIFELTVRLGEIAL